MVEHALLCRRHQKRLDRHVRCLSRHSPPLEIANRESIAAAPRGELRRTSRRWAPPAHHQLSETRSGRLRVEARCLATDDRFRAVAPMYRYRPRDTDVWTE